MSDYIVNKGIIEVKSGIPYAPRWFACGRLAFSMDERGIEQIDYFNPEQINNHKTVFYRRLWDVLRYYIEVDGKTLAPVYSNSKIFPYGIESEWDIGGDKFLHAMYATEEALVIKITTPKKLIKDYKLKFESYEESTLIGADQNDFRYSDRGMKREWQAWNYQGGAVCGSFREHYQGEEIKGDNNPLSRFEYSNLAFAMGCSFEAEYNVRKHDIKHILKSKYLESDFSYYFVLTFANSTNDAIAKKNNLIAKVEESICATRNRYDAVMERTPTLTSPYKELDKFMSLAPMYHEALKVLDYKGAIRAKTSEYWVWGWDGLTSNFATCYWGDAAFLRDMLSFYRDYADKDKGIGHYFRADMSIRWISSLPAQGMYISLLQQYCDYTGDIKGMEEFYPFAVKIFNMICEREVADYGMCEGTSLYPDYPEFMLENGNDLSVFNNTIFYSAARGVENLAAIMGDISMQKKSSEIARKIEKNFIPLFYDEDKKFVVASVDSKTLQRRPIYCSNSIKWDSGYIREVVEPLDNKIIDFFSDNVVTDAGLREIPEWCSAYDMDANQLHCWWPVTGEYFARLINATDRTDLVEKWVGWVSYWTKMLMCPEGISCYIDTATPSPDAWNSRMGAWHGYSMRGWYQAAIHSVVGMDIEVGGITFYPYRGKELSLTGLHYKGKILDIFMKGSGKYIDFIEVNGKKIYGTNKLPSDIMGELERAQITVMRTDTKTNPIIIKHGYGISMTEYLCDKGISATLTGAGLTRLYIDSINNIEVAIDGIKIECKYLSEQHTYIIEIDMQFRKQYKLKIS